VCRLFPQTPGREVPGIVPVDTAHRWPLLRLTIAPWPPMWLQRRQS
jgi:hypothetical protein